jgi:hypothetical protein
MKKKVAAPATPAAVAVAAPKVAPKGAVKLAVQTPADTLKEVATTPTKAPRAKKPAAPFRKSYPVSKTSTASLCGSLSAMQQARSILMNARGIGEALDTLTRLEAQARDQLSTAVTGELKARRVKTTGLNVGTESKPDGVHIVLTKPE